MGKDKSPTVLKQGVILLRRNEEEDLPGVCLELWDPWFLEQIIIFMFEKRGNMNVDAMPATTDHTRFIFKVYSRRGVRCC
jgi:hypothetical protein